jgi:hypothetical protein
MNNLCGVAQVWPPSCPSVPERDLLATRPHPTAAPKPIQRARPGLLVARQSDRTSAVAHRWARLHAPTRLAAASHAAPACPPAVPPGLAPAHDATAVRRIRLVPAAA